MADCAELDFHIQIKCDNINLKWYGFNDSLANFVGETIRKLVNFREAECEETFNQVKEQLQ